MLASDDLLKRNQDHRLPVDQPLPGAPRLRIAVVTCMDCRLDPAAAFGLSPGEAHILRNAGGVVTDDVVRSLAISQRKLGTREVMLVHHTKCGMATFTENDFKDELEQATGLRPTWSVEAFTSVERNVRQSINRVRQSPFLTETTQVRGFIYDVDTGAVTEVH